MNKRFLHLGILGLVLLALLALTGCSGQQAANTSDPQTKEQAKQEQKPIKLNFAHYFPSNHLLETEFIQGYIKAIDEATGGRVLITSFPAATLVPPTDTYDGVVKGVADIGFSAYAFTRGRFPVIETFLLPGIAYNNSESASWAIMEGIQKLNPKELQETHHLFTIGSGPGDLMINKKPIRKMEDLKGLQIGSTAGLRAEAIEALGGTPVILPMNEWYEALDKGIMNGGLAPVETLQGFRLGEVTGDYITLTPFLFNQLFFTVMNKDKWESMPPDIQKIFTETTDKYYAEKFPKLFDRIDTNAIKYIKEKKKVEFITLSEEEKTRWLEKIKPIQDKYIASLNEKGLAGDEVLKTVVELADKYNKQYPVAAPYMK